MHLANELCIKMTPYIFEEKKSEKLDFKFRKNCGKTIWLHLGQKCWGLESSLQNFFQP